MTEITRTTATSIDFATKITAVTAPCSYSPFADATIVSVTPTGTTLAAEVSSVSGAVLTLDPDNISSDSEPLQGRTLGYEVVV